MDCFGNFTVIKDLKKYILRKRKTKSPSKILAKFQRNRIYRLKRNHGQTS